PSSSAPFSRILSFSHHAQLLSTLPLLSLFTLRPPPRPTLFPYTTLFRSIACSGTGCSHRYELPRARPLDIGGCLVRQVKARERADRKSTRLNSSHLGISYAVFCLKKKIIK